VKFDTAALFIPFEITERPSGKILFPTLYMLTRIEYYNIILVTAFLAVVAEYFVSEKG